ncbi:MAG: hypothetical protein ISS47_09130 [Candidatus Omnitrophica bacterium]|nr:hypothetical protein [Candidatus Omnitrophota bacterium]
MSKSNRRNLIKEIQKQRKSKLLCYVTGDKPGFGTKIATDAIRFFYDHLQKISEKKNPIDKLDLFLYTRGGDTMVPWRIVSLFREYCKQFSVLIPYKAHSAGTLICLGATEIIMGKMGELSPVDPSVTTPFNPPTPGKIQEAKLDVSVEDVISYFLLAKEKVGLTEQQQLGEVFKSLSEKIHPLALGSINRAHSQIRKLARQLLELHMKGATQTPKIDNIVDKLTEKLFSHNYLISREEAKKAIGLKVIYSSDALEKSLWNLYLEYENDIGLGSPLNLVEALGSDNEKELTINRGFIESESLVDIFISKISVKKITQELPGPHGQPPLKRSGIQQNILEQRWQRDKEE